MVPVDEGYWWIDVDQRIVDINVSSDFKTSV